MKQQSEEIISYTNLIETYYGGVLDFTISRLQQLYQASRDLEENPISRENEPIYQGLKKISEKTIPYIKNNKIVWNNCYTAKFEPIFSAFKSLKSQAFLEWGTFSCFFKIFPHEYFLKLLKVGLDLPIKSESYNFGFDFYSNLLNFFEIVYFKKILVFKPRILSENIQFFDPLQRELIRKKNFNDSDINLVFFSSKFSIKSFVLKSLETFFHLGEIDWSSGLKTAHYKSLKMVLSLFEYGLWMISEMEAISSRMHTCSDQLLILEKKIKCARLSDEVKKSTAQLVLKCRITIGKILLHIITYHYDYEVQISYKSLGIDRSVYMNLEGFDAGSVKINPIKIYSQERFKKTKLHTYLTYILMGYLICPTQAFEMLETKKLIAKLSNLTSMLLGYISDMKQDFLMNSMRSLDSACASFYLLPVNNSYIHIGNDFFQQIVNLGKSLIKNQSDDYRSPVHPFYFKLEKVIEDIVNKIKFDSQDLEVFRAYQMGMLLNRIPQVLLSVLNLITGHEEFNPEKIERLIAMSFDLFGILCKDNLQCSNAFFDNYLWDNFTKLYQIMPVNGTFLLMQLTTGKTCTKIIFSNEKLKDFVYGNFRNELEKFSEVLEKNENPGPENFDKLRRIFFYCHILKTITKENEFFDARINIVIGEIMADKIGVILKKIVTNKSSINSEIDEKYDNLRTLEGFLQESETIIQTDPEKMSYFLLMACEKLIGVFAQCTHRFYLAKHFKKFKQAIDINYMEINQQHLLNSCLSKTIWKTLLRLYRIFEVYPENNLLINPESTSIVEIYFSKSKKGHQIHRDLMSFYSVLIETLKRQQTSKVIINLVFKSFLPLVFKFVSGLLSSLSDEVVENTSYEIQTQINGILIDFIQITNEIQCLMCGELDRNKTSIPEKFIEEFFMILNKEREIIDSSNKFKSNKIEFQLNGLNVLQTIGKIYTLKPDLFPSVFRFFRFSTSKRQNEMNSLMKSALSSHLKYRVEYGHDEKLKSDQEKAVLQDKYSIKNSRSSKNNYEIIFKNKFCLMGVSEKHSTFNDVFSALSVQSISLQKTHYVLNYYPQKYYKLRMLQMDGRKENQILRIFKINDCLYDHVDTFIDYFINEINKMSFSNIPEEQEVGEFLLFPQYRTLFILADNLLRIHDTYRERFHLSFSQNPKKTIVFKKIWRMRNIFFNLLTKRMFVDDFWSHLFIGFYILSCMIQNFCESNYFMFKKFIGKISENGQFSDLKEYHALIEGTITNSEIYLKKKPALNIRDRPELFPVLTRSIEEITEFISGGRIDPLEIYKYRSDIWIGIMFRVEPDINSEFYQLKKNVVLYICGMVESKNPEIVDFFVNKMFVRSVFKHCIILIKLLFKEYTKTPMAKNSRLVLAELIHLYKKNNPKKNSENIGFAKHVIIDIIVGLFGFIKIIAGVDLRYGQFVLYMEEFDKEHEIIQEPITLDENNANSLVCWRFLRAIVIEIEINAQVKDEKGNISTELIKYTFKKEPVCFFDQKEFHKEFFRTAPIGSLGSKHEQFFNHIEYAITKLKGEQKSYNKSVFLTNISSDYAFKVFLVILYLIVISINVLSLIFYNKKTKKFDNPNFGNASLAICILVFFEVGIAALCMLLWFFFKYPTVRKLKTLEMKEDCGGKTKVTLWQSFKYKVLQGVFLNRIWFCLFFHIVFPLIGFASPIFFCLMLFLIIDFSEVLKGVCLSIGRNLLRLFFTILIIIIVINFFSLLLTEYFNPEMSTEYKNSCNTYFSCFINSIKVAIVHDGGMSSGMQYVPDTSDQNYAGRYFFDLIYFILVNVFLLGMFFGIIVDAFSEYMKELNDRDDDQAKICFTCGLSKSVLERNGIGFDKHTEEHKIFSYMYYIIYLRHLDPNSYSGVDVQVAKILTGNNKAEFLPKYQTTNLLLKCENGDGIKKEMTQKEE